MRLGKLFISKNAKLAIDILLFVGIAGLGGGIGKTWRSPHCIGGSVWLILMLIHIAQHWQLAKSFANWNVIRKNKITALTFLGFALMLISAFMFALEFNGLSIGFHHVVSRLFFLFIAIHAIDKYRRFVYLFKTF